MNWPNRVCVVGAGKLGKLITGRFLTVYKPAQIHLCRGNQERLDELAGEFPGCWIHPSNREAVKGCDLIMLAVKPQDLSQVGTELAGYLAPEQMVLSVVTGKSFTSLQKHLQTDNLARASTSIFLADGRATTYLMCRPCVTQDRQQIFEQVALLWGEMCTTTSEEMIDLTIVELGAQAGILAFMLGQIAGIFQELGQDPIQAERNVLRAIESIARQCNDGKTLAEIVKQVKTKGGITEAAINGLVEESFTTVVKGGITASLKRTKEFDG